MAQIYDFLTGEPDGNVTTLPKYPDSIDFSKATPDELATYNQQIQAWNNQAGQVNAQAPAAINKTLNETNAVTKAQGEQANKVINTPVAATTGQTSAAPVATPEAPQEPDLAQMRANVPQISETQGNDKIQTVYAKLNDLFAATTPKYDEKKAERLKRIAKINSIGELLTQGIVGVMAAKGGGPVTNVTTNTTPKALAEYNQMLAEDKSNKYRTALLQAQSNAEGLKAQAQNELANKRYNMEQKAAVENLINKFNLDKYAKNEEYRMKVQEMLMKYGIDVDLLAKKNDYDEKKTKAQMKHDVARDQYREQNANYRANLKGDKTGGAARFTGDQDQIVPIKMPDGTIKYLSGTEAYQILGQISKRASEEAGTNKITDPLFNRMGNNDFTAGEASALIAAYGMDLVNPAPYNYPTDPLEPQQVSKPTTPANTQPAKKGYTIHTW